MVVIYLWIKNSTHYSIRKVIFRKLWNLVIGTTIQFRQKAPNAI